MSSMLPNLSALSAPVGAPSEEEEFVIEMDVDLYFYGHTGQKRKIETEFSESLIAELPGSRTVLTLHDRLDGRGFIAHITQLRSDDAYDYEMYAFLETPLPKLEPIPGITDPSRKKNNPYVYGVSN